MLDKYASLYYTVVMINPNTNQKNRNRVIAGIAALATGAAIAGGPALLKGNSAPDNTTEGNSLIGNAPTSVPTQDVIQGKHFKARVVQKHEEAKPVTPAPTPDASNVHSAPAQEQHTKNHGHPGDVVVITDPRPTGGASPSTAPTPVIITDPHPTSPIGQ